MLRILTGNIKLRRNYENVFLHSGQLSNSISSSGAGSMKSNDEEGKERGREMSVFHFSLQMSLFHHESGALFLIKLFLLVAVRASNTIHCLYLKARS